MDRRHNYGIMLDTETSIDTAREGMEYKKPLVFDIGWQVIDSNGNKYKERSYVVSETYFNTDIMRHFFAQSKLPRYAQDIEDGRREVLPFRLIKQIFLHDYKAYRCKFVMAHNLPFDDRALKATAEYINGTTKTFFPYGTEKWDTMTMAKDVLKNNKSYKKFCFSNNFVTKHKNPQPQVKAEIIYKFISKNVNFIESHTGLEDVEIEREIFKFCKRSHKKMRKNAYKDDESIINKPFPNR